MTNSTNQKKQFSKWRRTRLLASFIALLLCFAVQAQTVQLEQYSLVKKQWQNGNEHVSYQEGNAVPYRLILQGLPEGNNTVTISYDITGSSSANHAIDYLTDFNTTAKFDDNTNPAADILINTPFPSSGFGDLSPYNFSQTGFLGGTMYIIGGAITVVSFVEGNPGVKNSSTSATINFTIPAGGGNVVILWGGHLALDSDYPGVNDGAGGIHGSPYHMRALTLNGSSAGHRDRSVRVGLSEECTDLPVSGSCSPVPLCETTPGGGTATFDLTQCSSSIGSNYTSIQWYDANDVAISDPEHFLAANGTQVYAILSNDCGQSDPVFVTLHVNPLPVFGTISPANTCDGQSNGSVSLANSVVGTDYELKSCDGTVSYGTKSGTGGTLTWPGLGAGSYKIVATNTSTTCSNTSSCVTVGVNPLPSIGTITPAPTCKGTSNGTITLAASASGINYTLQSCNGASSYGTKAGTGTALNWTGLAAGDYRIVAVNATTGCSRTSSCVTVIAAICDATLTQGFYGNVNGKNCNGKTALVLMQAALGGSNKVFGVDTRSFTLKTTDLTGSKPNIFILLPGGGTPKYLDATCQTKSGNICIAYYPTASYDNKPTWPAVPISNGNINNNLLAQTMTLFFNVKSSASLKDVTLTGNVLTFYNLDCGSSKPGGFASTQTIPYCVFKYLQTNYASTTIDNLLDLANRVLGGAVPSISASDMNDALNAINVGFDKGKALVTQTTSGTCASMPITVRQQEQIQQVPVNAEVSVYPNPYMNKVNFIITSPVAGKATLQVYNALGQNARTIFTGYLQAGQKQTVSFDVPPAMQAMLFYKLQVGDQQLNGKVLQAKNK